MERMGNSDMEKGKSAQGPIPGRLQRGMPGVKPKNMKGTLRRLWKLTKGHRQGLAWVFLCSGLAAGSAILSPYLIGEVINRIDAGHPFIPVSYTHLTLPTNSRL